METCDSKAWLDEHGSMDDSTYMYDIDLFCTTWKSHNGFITVGYGKTKDITYENLFESIKSDLFEWCNVYEQY